MITARTCEKRGRAASSPRTTRRPARRLWKFYNTPAPGEPGGNSWGNVPLERTDREQLGTARLRTIRCARCSTGRSPIPNPGPAGSATATSTPSRGPLHPNSTATRRSPSIVETGKLVWYYQHLPGDDWDLDHIHERTLVRTAINPDPAAVKWINPNITRGEVRDVVVEVAEAGGIWRARPRDRAVHLGHALPARRSRLPYLPHRRRYRPHPHELGQGEEEGWRPGSRVLPQHPELLVHRLPSRQERALHSLPRRLPRHDRELQQSGRLRAAPAGHASGRRSQEIRIDREGESVDRQGRYAFIRNPSPETGRPW